MQQAANDLLGYMGQQARAVVPNTVPQYGEVASYNPDNNTVRVKLYPQAIVTGDIQLFVPWVGPTGCGMQFGPEVGTQVLVVPMDTTGEHKVCILSAYNDKFKAPGAPAGDVWFLFAAKTFIKYLKAAKTLLLGAETAFQVVSPLVELGAADLTADDGVVRKSDLQAVVDDLNNLRDWCTKHKHVGNMGAPTPVDPTDAATISTAYGAAEASATVKAKE